MQGWRGPTRSGSRAEVCRKAAQNSSCSLFKRSSQAGMPSLPARKLYSISSSPCGCRQRSRSPPVTAHAVASSGQRMRLPVQDSALRLPVQDIIRFQKQASFTLNTPLHQHSLHALHRHYTCPAQIINPCKPAGLNRLHAATPGGMQAGLRARDTGPEQAPIPKHAQRQDMKGLRCAPRPSCCAQ